VLNNKSCLKPGSWIQPGVRGILACVLCDYGVRARGFLPFSDRGNIGKEVFIGTVVISAVVVDVSRLIIYGFTFFSRDYQILKTHGGIELVVAGTLAAFIGAFAGSRLVKKITMRTVRTIVGGLLLLVALSLGTGMI